MGVSELDLVRRARGGDREAFGELVDRYRNMVYGLGYHLTGEFEAARDLAQEAFVQAYRRLSQLREPERFAGWLRQIAINCHRTEARRKRVSTVALTEAEATPTSSLPSEVELVVREALEKLRPPERLALTLHYINGYSHAEIGGFLGVRPEVVNSRLARARRHLREEVLAMAEEMFEEHALPAEFREDVVGAVDDLVARLLARLPEDLSELLSRLPQAPSWCSILDRMPEPYGRPLREAQIPTDGPERGWPILEQRGEGGARVGDLPEELQRDVRRAIGRLWIGGVFAWDGMRPPWLQDLGQLWVRYYEGEHGGFMVAFSNAPENPGFAATAYLGPEEGDPMGPPTPVAELDRALETCEVPEGVRVLVKRLREAVPGGAGSLGALLHSERARRLCEVRAGLSSEVRAAMAAGTRVWAKDLPEHLQEVLREDMHLGWGAYVVAQIEHAPTWLTHVEEARVEFGLLPKGFPGDSTGKVYLMIRGPLPYGHSFWTLLDCPAQAKPSARG